MKLNKHGRQKLRTGRSSVILSIWRDKRLGSLGPASPGRALTEAEIEAYQQDETILTGGLDT